MNFIINSILILATSLFMMQCGRAYFPMELKTGSRSERVKGQEVVAIKLVSLTHKSLKSVTGMFIIERLLMQQTRKTS